MSLPLHSSFFILLSLTAKDVSFGRILMISHNQLQLILDVLGTPTIDEFYAITSRRSKEYIRSLPFRKKVPFKVLYPKASDEAIDFLDHTLTCMSLLLPLFFSLIFTNSSFELISSKSLLLLTLAIAR